VLTRTTRPLAGAELLDARKRALTAQTMLTGALVAGFVAAWRERRSIVGKSDTLLEEDLEAGLAEVFSIAARGVVRANPDFEETPAFLLEVADGLVFLAGPYLQGLASSPSREIEIVRLPRSKRVLSFTSRGEPLPFFEPAPTARYGAR